MLINANMLVSGNASKLPDVLEMFNFVMLELPFLYFCNRGQLHIIGAKILAFNLHVYKSFSDG